MTKNKLLIVTPNVFAYSPVEKLFGKLTLHELPINVKDSSITTVDNCHRRLSLFKMLIVSSYCTLSWIDLTRDTGTQLIEREP